jgi:hypothetical protein
LGHSYNSKYEIVNRANAVIINVPNITMDKTLKDRILGEAYFLRGFANWRLHVIYGEVVLISDQDLSNNNFNKPKSSIEEVRKAIEEDWLKAEHHCNMSTSVKMMLGTESAFGEKLTLERK